MHQPYRKGERESGAPLTAMRLGRPGYLPNPQDSVRDTQRRRHRDRPVHGYRGLGAYLVRKYRSDR